MAFTHVLILEDDHELSRMYEKILVHKGFRTIRTHTVEQAIDQLDSFDPDVVCLDWELERTTSAPFLEHLRGLDHARIPKVLLISGKATRTEMKRYGDLVQAMIPKPATLHQIVKGVTALSEAAKGRVPIQHIKITPLADGVVKLVWSGRITRHLIRETMHQALRDAHTVVFDIHRLAMERIDMTEFGLDRHPPLPNLKRVFVIHDKSSRTHAEFLLSFLGKGFETHYCTDEQAAIQQALIAVAQQS